jgi:hypothetical protein
MSKEGISALRVENRTLPTAKKAFSAKAHIKNVVEHEKSCRKSGEGAEGFNA